MADGSIRIGVDVEIAKAEKELSNLNKELSKQTNSVAKLESQYRLLQKEKEVTFLGAPLDTTITKLKAQEAELEKLKTEYTQLKATTDYSNAEEVKGLVKKANKLDKFTEEIKNQKQDLAMFSAVKDEPTKKQWSLQFKMDNANAEIDGLNKKIATTEQKITELSNKSDLRPLSESLKDTSFLFENLKTVSLNCFSVLVKAGSFAFKTIGAVAKKAWGLIISPFKNFNKRLSGFNKRLKTAILQGLIFRPIRTALTNMLQAYSQLMMANADVSNSFAQVKGAAIYAFQPFLTAIVPIIKTVCNWIVMLIQFISQLLSILFKISGGSKSAAKNLYNQSKATGAASKANEKFLASWDTIQQVKQKSGGGGAGDGLTPSFDFDEKTFNLDALKKAIEKGDWYGVGRLIGEKLNQLNKIIDDWIKKIAPKAHEWALQFTNALNGILDAWDPTLAGKTLGDGINLVLDVIDTVFSNFHWATLGKKLGQFINSLFDTIDWALLGKTISDGILGVLTMLYTFLETVDWKKFGDDVRTALINIDWFGMLKAVGRAIVDAVIAGIDFTSGLTGINFDGIVDLFNELKDTIQKVFSVIKGDTSFKDFFKSLSDGNIFMLTFITVLGGLALGFGAANTAAKLLIKGTLAVGAALDFLAANPIVLIIAGIVALIAVIVLCIKHWQAIKDFIAGFVSFVAADFKDMVDTVKSLLTEMVNFLKEILNGLGEVIKFIVNAIVTTIVTIWTNCIQNIEVITTALVYVLTTIWNTIKTTAVTMWNALKDAVISIWNAMKTTAITVWTSLKDGVINIINLMVTDIPTLIKKIVDDVVTKFTEIEDKVIKVWDNVKSGISNKLDEITTKFSNWYNNDIKPWFTVEKWFELGQYAIQGLINGLNSAWDKITAWGGTLLQKVKDVFGIHSPSTEFASIGSYLVLGLLKGLNEHHDELVAYFMQLIYDVVDAVKEDLTAKLITYIQEFITQYDADMQTIRAINKKTFDEAMYQITKIIAGLNAIPRFVTSTITITTFHNDIYSVKKTTDDGGITYSEQAMPKLAQGSVVNPGHQFTAILGDNRYEQEVVSPLSTMKQAFMEAMQESGYNKNGNITLQIDGQTFARITNPYLQKETSRIGIKATGGTA